MEARGPGTVPEMAQPAMRPFLRPGAIGRRCSMCRRRPRSLVTARLRAVRRHGCNKRRPVAARSCFSAARRP